MAYPSVIGREGCLWRPSGQGLGKTFLDGFADADMRVPEYIPDEINAADCDREDLVIPFYL